MLERLLVLVAALGGMLLYDGIALRNKITKREKKVYIGLLVVSLYLSADYAYNQDWLDMYDVVEPVLGGLAEQIDTFLKVQW
ncbi:hypothetical protein L1N85_13345 [Paenibacillus alkaliterrae]|uniref:hypothetical protein n=1 Tax=Paenibacillus alkaliterrae TaxID=320909 RepID=UPI001F48A0E3|nr:hypothetical protein [Paenibacillus alkaliterrae]MCF2939407.1 hypothetical protein [Paenibacillus alkaliterrae]